MEKPIFLAVIAAFILGYGTISKRLQKTVITPPMMFVLFGLLLSRPVSNLLDIEIESEIINFIAEITLVLILFTDASRIDLRLLRQEHDIPVRLLTIGLPLTMIAGAVTAALLFEALTFWEAVVLAIILAPTDAALGQAVVSSRQVPVRIRQALNVESGLNDGIALPILLFFVSVAGAAETLENTRWFWFGARQILLGPAAGIGVGYLGGILLSWAEKKGWVDEAFQKLIALGLAFLSFALAELIGGNGFIAAFTAGIVIGNLFQGICDRLYQFAEAEGQLLTLITFMIYGATMVLPAFDQMTWNILIYAILSLTVIRLIPSAISLIGLRLHLDTILFLGWFGPRGIASILYGLIIVEEIGLSGRDLIFDTMIVTVFFSIFAHGLTAVPAAKVYGSRVEARGVEPDRPELAHVTEMPTRLRYRS